MQSDMEVQKGFRGSTQRISYFKVNFKVHPTFLQIECKKAKALEAENT